MQGQAAAAEALRAGREDNYASVEKMRKVYDQRRRIMLDGFAKMGLPCFEPLGAFYVFPNIAGLNMKSDEFCEKLLREQKVDASSFSCAVSGGNKPWNRSASTSTAAGHM